MATEFYDDEGEGREKSPIHLNCLLIGPEGCGKTTLLKTFPNPFIVTFSTDQGYKQLAGRANGVDVHSWEDFRDYFINKLEGPIRAGQWKSPKTGKPYKTLGLDGMSLLGIFVQSWARMQPASVKANGDDRVVSKFIKTAMQEIFTRFQNLPGIHTVVTCHSTEKRTRGGDGNYTVTGLEPEFPGYWGEAIPKQVFARLWMQWVIRAEDALSVPRTYLRPYGMMNASVKRDGHGEGTPYVLPPYIDYLTFGLLADWLTVCGVPVFDAPGTTFAQPSEEVAET